MYRWASKSIIFITILWIESTLNTKGLEAIDKMAFVYEPCVLYSVHNECLKYRTSSK